MASEENNRGAFLIQEHYCRHDGRADLCAACAPRSPHGLTRDSADRRARARLAGRADARRAAAAADRRAARAGAGGRGRRAGGGLFRGESTTPDGDRGGARRGVLMRHDAALLPWLDGPPQTNEPGRSAALMTGLIEVARRHGPQHRDPRDRVERRAQPADRSLSLRSGRRDGRPGRRRRSTIAPEWRGAAAARGADRDRRRCAAATSQPMDATDPAVEARLAAYVWAEKPDAAGAAARARSRWCASRPVRAGRRPTPPTGSRRGSPSRRPTGVTRVLMHSVVWQYLPDADRRADHARRWTAAGARATRRAPARLGDDGARPRAGAAGVPGAELADGRARRDRRDGACARGLGEGRRT